MAQRGLLIGIGAGIVAAALYATVVTYSLIAVVLFYLAPLPLFIAGLGWGSLTAAVGAGAGSAVIMAVTGFRSGLLFALSVGLAPVIISYLALLSRDVGEAAEDEGAPKAQGREYYPEGRLVLWTALLAGLLVTITVLLLGPDAESFRAILRDTVRQMLAAQPGLSSEIDDTTDLQAMIELFVAMMPPASAMLWLIATLVNLALAVKVLTISGRNVRPWAPFGALAFPRLAMFAPLIAVAAALLPGTGGLLGGVYLAVLITAFAILGLSVCHALVAGTASRPFLLAGIYAVLVVFNWVAVLALAGLGLAETATGLRQRLSRGGPPAPT